MAPPPPPPREEMVLADISVIHQNTDSPSVVTLCEVQGGATSTPRVVSVVGGDTAGDDIVEIRQSVQEADTLIEGC